MTERTRDVRRRNEAALRQQVEQLAAERGFGRSHVTHTLGGGGSGCAACLAAAVLVPVGVGLLVGDFPVAVTGLAVAFLVLALVLPVAALRRAAHRDHLIARLHLYDGGLVLTGPAGASAHAWADVRVTEDDRWVRSGQHGAQERVERLVLRDRDGEVLASMGGTDNLVQILRLVEQAPGER